MCTLSYTFYNTYPTNILNVGLLFVLHLCIAHTGKRGWGVEYGLTTHAFLRPFKLLTSGSCAPTFASGNDVNISPTTAVVRKWPHYTVRTVTSGMVLELCSDTHIPIIWKINSHFILIKFFSQLISPFTHSLCWYSYPCTLPSWNIT